MNNLDSPVPLDQSDDYHAVTDEARRIIDQLINQSLAHVNDTVDVSEQENVEIPISRGRFIESENEVKAHDQSFVQWPSIVQFTNENIGIEKINEYIEKEWKTSSNTQDDCWLYAIDFLECKSFEFNDLYIYRVRYSIPTRRQPIPRHTASVYFTIDVSKIKPKNNPVKVSFVFETKRVIHHPSNFRFRQNWLEDIILLKENLANGIDF